MNFDTPLALFQHLLAIDEDNMAVQLSILMSSEHEFYTETTALITAHEENKKQTTFKQLIGKQAEQLVDDNIIHDLINTQVSVYKLTRKLGQGGMGAVYLGERNDGQLAQKVAIKFVYPSIAALAGEDFLQKEAQHLANLDHTNIAKIYTVDKTENNLPYMVMEYVDGIAIDQFCNANALRFQERLKLFKKVCKAVQFAHQHMVIHADIKPSNILVDKQGEPKLMDFGIAQNINSTMNGNTLKNEQKYNHLKALSRDYASPEQLAGNKLSTTSDVYALGKNLTAMLGSDMVIPNEVKAIISKSTESDIEKRYSSSFELSQSITKFINKQPISEYSNTLMYKISKFFQRNKLVSSISLSLIITIAISSYSLYSSNTKLIEQVEVSEEVTSFLTDMFDASDIDKNSVLTVEELIDNSSKKALESVNKSPKVKAHLLKAIAKVYQGRGLLKESEELYNKALPLFDKNDESFYIAQNELAQVYISSGRKSDAKTAIENSINNANTEKIIYEAYNLMGLALHSGGTYQESRRFYQKSLSGYKSLLPIDNFMVATVLGNLGSSFMMEGKNEEALEYFAKAVDLDIRMYGDVSHPRTALHLQQFGAVQAGLGNFAMGLTNLKKAAEMFQEISPEGHPRVHATYNNIATIYGRDLKKPKQALEYSMMALNSLKGEDLKDSIALAVIYHNIAANNRDIGEYKTSIEWHKKSLKTTENLNIQGYIRAVQLGGYGETLVKVEDNANALNYLNQAIAMLKVSAPTNQYLARFEKLVNKLSSIESSA